MDDYERMCALDNLRRAYRWVLSNPEVLYKGYFRDCYTAYAASSDHNLRRLRRSLIRRAYQPGYASKHFFPKASGILRPYTLLTVNDQIVYQACINIVAESLYPRIKKRYFKSIFGHLYAGKRSKFFYFKWQNGYRAYSDAVLDGIDVGLTYVANFDLASFYDSIDHSVLAHFLHELGLDRDLVGFICECLRRWTSCTWTNVPNVIYHGHGIPQGPLASGLLSEVVLQHIDERGARGRRARYFRYVDDIKILAKSENALRQRLVALDLAAKEIGLFPQSSKVNIRQVEDPLEEIKSVSRPPESAITPSPKQTRIRVRLRSLIRQGKVRSENLTRFKFLLARALPHSSLNARLISVIEHHPDLAFQVASYFSKYRKLPSKAAVQLLSYLTGDEIYHAVHGVILFATLDNMQEPQKSVCANICYKRLFEKSAIPPQPSFKAALLAWVIRNNKVTYAQLRKLFASEVDWWVRKDFLKYVDEDQYGRASFEELLNIVIRAVDAEPARVGSLRVVEHDLNIDPPIKSVHESARLLLYAAGQIRHIGQPESLIGTVLSYVLSADFRAYNWRQLLKDRHQDAEHIAFVVKSYYESDINSCIVTLDSLCDLVWEAVYKVELPNKQYGQYGAMLKHTALLAKYPRATAGLAHLHQLRKESLTAHPRDQKTGKSTRRLRHYDFNRASPIVREAILEIIAKVVV